MAVAAVSGEISVNSTQPLMIWMHKGLYIAAKSLIRQSRVRVEVEAQGWVVDNFFKLPVTLRIAPIHYNGGKVANRGRTIKKLETDY